MKQQAATLLLPFLLVLPFSLTSTETSQDKNLILNSSAQDEKSLYQVMAAELALDREHPDVALANYIAAAKETQDPLVASRATQVALTVGSLEDAIEPAAIWATLAPQNLEAQITTAALYLRLHDIDKAVPYLQKTQELNPTDAFQYFLILFRQLQNSNDNQYVVDALKKLSKDNPTFPSANLALAEIYLFQNNPKDALTLTQDVLKIEPHSTIGIQLHSEALLRAQGKEIAKSYLDSIVKKKEATDASLNQYYAQFLYENDYKEDARRQIEKIVKNPNLNAEELLHYARLSIQAQWYDLSKKILLRSSKLEESKDLSHYFLARIAEMQNHDKEAVEWFKQVLTGPFHVLSQIRASIMLSEKQKYDDALTVLSRTQASDPTEQKQLLLTTVEILNQAKRYPESLEQLNAAIVYSPEDIEYRYARSLIAEKSGNIQLAETDLKAILELQPQHLDALNALGYILTNQTNRFQEAEKYLQQAIALSPNNPSILDSMGWLYYKMGNYPQSVIFLQKAQEIQPDGEIAAHLGEVLWKMNNYEAAKRVWNQALELHPKHENVLNAMQRLIPTKKEK